MKFSFIAVSAVAVLMTTVASATETLNVTIPSSYQPMLKSLSPRLSEQLGMVLAIEGKRNDEIYQDLNQKKLDRDIIFFIENKSLAKDDINHFLSQNSQIIAASQVVLWCPHSSLRRRVTAQDTVLQSDIKSIALPIKDNRAHQIFVKNIPKLSVNTKLITTRDTLMAWRMARKKQAQCAVTLDKWLRPNEQVIRISGEQIVLRGYINPNLKNPAKAQQMLNLLSSPLIQPLMMRSTNAEFAHDTAIRPKRTNFNLWPEAAKRSSRIS